MFIRQNDTGKIALGPAVAIGDGYTTITTLDLSTADSAYARLGDDGVIDISGYTFAAIATMDGLYDLTLQTGITDTIGPLDIMIEDVSLCLPIYQRFYVVEETVYDALFATSSAGFGATATITMSALTQTTPPATPTPDEAAMYLYTELVRNKVITSTDGTDFKYVYNNAGDTVIYKKSIADAASVFTVGTAETGP